MATRQIVAKNISTLKTEAKVQPVVLDVYWVKGHGNFATSLQGLSSP